MAAAAGASTFLLEQLPALAQAAKLGHVVDLACGEGRHALALAEHGIPVLGIDRRAEALRMLHAQARGRALPIELLRADLEGPPGLPIAPQSCAALLVFRYLHRPLAAALEQALQPGGLLIYETFTIHQKEYGYGPVNPAFLLEPGELPRLFPGLEVLAAWEGIAHEPRPAAIARLLARRRSAD